MDYIQFLGWSAAGSGGILLAMLIFAIIITSKTRKHAYEDIRKARNSYPTACTVSPTTEIPPTSLSYPTKYTLFKDKEGNILNPDDFQIFISKGESGQFTEINDNSMVFVKEGRDFDFPAIMVISRLLAPKEGVQYKIRRGWRFCKVNEARIVVEKILQSKAFNLVRHLPSYDSDTLLLEDFVHKRLKRYVEEHPFSEDERDTYSDIIICTTYHSQSSPDSEDRGRIRFSIYPARLVVGEVTQSFPT